MADTMTVLCEQCRQQGEEHWIEVCSTCEWPPALDGKCVCGGWVEPGEDPPAEVLAIRQARRLVHKIQAEEARGTPLHPAGLPDCSWTLADGGYPAEYAALVHTLEELAALDEHEEAPAA